MLETWVWSLGRSPGGGHGNPLQYSCLENPTNSGARQGTVHRIAKSQTQLKRLSMHTLIILYLWTFPPGPAVRTASPKQGAWIWSLDRELKSHMPYDGAKKNKKQNKKKTTFMYLYHSCNLVCLWSESPVFSSTIYTFCVSFSVSEVTKIFFYSHLNAPESCVSNLDLKSLGT